MRPSLFASLFVVCCGACAGWLVWQLVPVALRHGIPGLHRQDYRLVPNDHSVFEINDARWLSVPFLFADFDLQMDVELGEKVDLDVLLRQVEPRVLGSEFVPFHGRFSVLRLSTNGSGPAWRTRDDALFEPRNGGAELAAGYGATVWVQARGRALRANVAGKWYPWFLADDEYGALTLVANGGKAALHRMVIETRAQPRSGLWSWWPWVSLGAMVGAVLALACRMVALRPRNAVIVGLVGIALVWLQWWLLCVPDALRHPAPAALALPLAAPAALAFVVLARSGLQKVLSVVLVALTIASSRHWMHGALCTPTAAVDAYFGPASGSAPSEALAQRVRGLFEVHDVSPARNRVFLLGGQLLYNRGAPTEHLAPLLSGDLRGRLQHAVEVPCLPTVDGHTTQQWRLFTKFYGGYRPQVVVFGVPRDEAAFDSDGRPRSSPEQLAATLIDVRAYCKQHELRLVLFTEARLPAALLEVLQGAASAGLPLVIAGDAESPAALSARLADAIAPLFPGQTPR